MTAKDHSFSMKPAERRAGMALALVFAFRMLGLFLILPVFALYADQMAGATPVTIGLAIGAYGLTQALLQIPFGVLSDKIGRKPVIVFGLLLFALGSAVAAMSTNIDGVIAGRFLQGAGAIAAAIMALAADLTREVSRTKIMAMIGMSIGTAFILSLILGPMLAVGFGIGGIFWITAVLALAGVVVVLFVVPTPEMSALHRDAEAVPAMIGRAIADFNLFRLNFGVFTLHMSLTAVFLVVPLMLRDRFGLETASHWQLYLPVMLASMALMVPFVVVAEKKHRLKEMLVGGVAVAAFAMLAMSELPGGIWPFALVMVLFFAAFNLLEAIMPSWVSKVAAAEMRGTAMGVFSSSQFAGAFFGGLAGGWIHQQFGVSGVFFFAAGMLALWLVSAATIERPPYLNNFLLPIVDITRFDLDDLGVRLSALDGVTAVQIIAKDGIAYMKVDNRQFDDEAAFAVVEET